jgi:hypothetical protein
MANRSLFFCVPKRHPCGRWNVHLEPTYFAWQTSSTSQAVFGGIMPARSPYLLVSVGIDIKIV